MRTAHSTISAAPLSFFIRTGGFAPPPYDGFALIDGLQYLNSIFNYNRSLDCVKATHSIV
jgi:hypothetical protein